MVKSGVIVGVVMLILALGAGMLSPFCSICVAIPAGIAAGYLASLFDKPVTSAIQRAAGAGAITGAIAIIGQMIAALINASFVKADTLNRILGQQALSQNSIWVIQLGAGVCIGLLNVAIAAGLGAVGGLLWQQIQSRPSTPPAYPTNPQF